MDTDWSQGQWARRHDHITPVLNNIPLISRAQESHVQDCGVGVEVS